MKKNTALLNILITLILFITSSLSFAENVVPTPQVSRINALETSLKLRQLTHQIETLEANGEKFLTLYKSSLTSSTQGCVIILHADNEHPDWPDAVAPLRNALPEHSWCTLSIEVPDIIKRATPVATQITTQEATNNQQALKLPNQETVSARITAAINKVQNDGIEQVAFLGYKTGAAYVLNFLANNPTTAEALILIDVSSPVTVSNYDLAQQIRQVPQPVLDYYVNSNADSNQFATWRQQAANQRTEIRGYFTQLDALPDRVIGKDSKQLLIQRVRGFLKQNTSQINQRKTLPNVQKGLFYESP